MVIPSANKDSVCLTLYGLCLHDPVSFHKSLSIPNALLIAENRESIQDSHLLNLSLIKLKLICLQYTHTQLLNWVSQFLVHLPLYYLGPVSASFILIQL